MQSLAMQPPPSRSSPGVANAAGAPPSGGTPNAFRRNTPFRRPNTPLSGAPLPPVTDPFGLSRPNHPGDLAAPHGANSGGPLLPPPLLSQQDGSHAPPRWPADTLHNPQGSFPGQPITPGERSEPCGAPAAPLAPMSRFGDGQFFPVSPPDAGQGLPPEPSYFHTGLGPEGGEFGPRHGAAPSQARNSHGQEPLPFPPGAPAFPPQLQPSTSSQWVASHGSRPPSVQNYFQPSDPQTQGFGSYYSPAQLPPFPAHQNPAPGSFCQQQHPPPESFAQFAGGERKDSSRPPPFHPSQHQQNFSGAGLAHPEDWAHSFPREPCPQQSTRPDSLPPQSGHPPDSDPGTVSMFFKGGEAENKETLAINFQCGADVATGDAFQPSQGLLFSGLPPPESGQQAVGRASGVEAQGFLPPPPAPYGVYIQGSGGPAEIKDPTMPQRGGDGLTLENDENSEFAPNQEVLPSEPERISLGFQPVPGLANQGQHVTKNIGTAGGPPVNQETPDVTPHPLRSDSISSNHSSTSHSSGSSLRRSQLLPNTFIQQESGKPPTDAVSCFFEQIDTSPLALDPSYPGREAESAGRTMYYSQLPHPTNPTSPKPMATFQASANSSFEPVRSHGQFAVKGAEVDQASMVMELGQAAVSTVGQQQAASDISPGNLEQPPDNLENITIPHTRSNLCAGPGAPESMLPPMPEMSEKRTPLRMHGARAKAESPAATLWAQSELPNFTAGIVLALAAPAMPTAAKEPCAEVGPPPQDGSKEASYPVLVGNMENLPQAPKGVALKGQASSSYATLLMPSLAAPTPPVLLARPLQTSSSASKSSPDQPLRDRGDGQSVSFASPAPPAAGLATALGSPPAQTPLNLAADGHLDLRFAGGGPPTRDKSTPAASPPSNRVPGATIIAPTSALQPRSDISKDDVRNPGFHQPESSANCELLDFTLRRSPPNQPIANANQPASLPLNNTTQHLPPCQTYVAGLSINDKPGFYLQVTKDVQQQQQPMATMTGQQAVPPPLPPTAHDSDQHQPGSVLAISHGAPVGYGYPELASAQPATQQQSVAQVPVTTAAAASQLPSHQEVPLQQPYPQGLPQAGYSYPYPYLYQDYGTDPQQAYAGPYPSYPPVDPRVGQQIPYPPMSSRGNHPYYQGDPYRRYNAQYARYDANNAGSKDQERERTSRPSSRTSQSSDRPSSRQGCTEDPYNGRSGREAYAGYYADYYNGQYQYRDPAQWERYDLAAYDPRYRDYRDYDRPYWYYGPYQAREPYYREPYGDRRNGYEELWQYDPRYDSSFDESSRREPYPDEFDRRSTHSEHSAHSVLSSHSVRSRRSSFSSQSQQSQVYRSQQDLAVPFEQPSQTTIAADYTYGQYSENTVQPNYSDYQYGYPAETGWQPVETAPPRPVTPEKFTIPHLCVRFSPGGQLLKVLSNLPSEGQPALVEIHSLETMLQHMPEQEELRNFPGPLAKEETHKVDVINFSQNKATECLRNEELLDKESANLLWDLIVLLCRQNGTVIGTDIAELLLREHRSVWLPGKSPNEANLIDFNNDLVPRAEDESCASLLTDSFLDNIVTECSSKDTERFRELLLFGRKKDALESAMKHGLWGHALLLASKMDNRTHAKVMTRFANSLPINDPLQTVYQLMSGRMPAAATCCGEEKWGDWRPHLAMVLSNLSNGPDLDRRTITTMGDTLAVKGLLDASHFCYLMAQVGFGVYTRKSTKLVLIGSNHSWSFLKFASNEAIQRTEAYEYAQALGSQTCFLPNFQVFKFIYACRLAEMGLAAQAFHYCEVISRTILRNPAYYSHVLLGQLIQISSQLRFSDPQLKERSEQELQMEPDWIQQLRQIEIQLKDGGFVCGSGRATPQPFCSSTPSSEYDQVHHAEELPTGSQEEVTRMENPLMTSFVPDAGSTEVPGVQLMPAAPHAVLDGRLMAAPPTQSVTDGTVPLYSPTHSSPGFPGQSPNSAFRQPCDLLKGPFSPGLSGPPPGPLVEPLPTVQEQVHVNAGSPDMNSINHQISPKRHSFGEAGQHDFYDPMAKMAPGRRSSSASQSSLHMPYGRRSRTTSESSNHSMGRERHRSAANQPTLPPQPEVVSSNSQEGKKEPKREQPVGKKGKGGWLSWLRSSKKNEAHLPDDKNKSIVWDEKRQRWVNMNEPEEESKPLPPPPSLPMAGLPSGSNPLSFGGHPSVNRFSRKAGTKARYVDVLNPSGPRANGGLPPPGDLFAPLAPMPIPTNFFVPVPGEGPLPPEGGPAEIPQSMEQMNSEANLQAQVPPPAQGGSAQGTVQFYNPAQFAQPTASATASRSGRFGQRKYPTLK
ncbi:protein transport protein Sec16A isoform X2 [Amblyraja radiata]|uniref:protein transport protein Sec16A isoform X2 n=1 Tax=Amblyraja radiata TaxID=386614 RepID=UPI001402B84C|nr:protein transport protein Sec16A isoform X2 [Amblyraja radiata]